MRPELLLIEKIEQYLEGSLNPEEIDQLIGLGAVVENRVG